MPEYALLKDGQFVRGPVLAEPDFEFPGFSKAPFDASIHFHPAVEPKEILVKKDWFLFKLHTFAEISALKGWLKEANDTLDKTAWLRSSVDPIEIGMKMIVISFDNMNVVEEIDLKSDGVVQFLMGAKLLGVYTGDADARVAQILANQLPN